MDRLTVSPRRYASCALFRARDRPQCIVLLSHVDPRVPASADRLISARIAGRLYHSLIDYTTCNEKAWVIPTKLPAWNFRRNSSPRAL